MCTLAMLSIAGCILASSHKCSLSLTCHLMQLVVEDLQDDDSQSEHTRKWADCLSEATWPDILRRLAILHQSIIPDNMMASVQLLGTVAYEQLAALDKLRVLCMLCDEVLDTQKLRQELQRRFEVMKQVCCWFCRQSLPQIPSPPPPPRST
jgi:hypothetical protein